MNIAIIQMNSTENKKGNISVAKDMVLAAIEEGAEFIVLPEVFSYRAQKFSRTKAIDSLEGDAISVMKSIAKEKEVCILAGSICEEIKGSKKLYNTSALISPDGEIVAVYRKRNLFNVVIDGKKVDESKHFKLGEELVVADLGNGFKVGLSTCFDIRFPDMYQAYQEMGVNLICVPSSFTQVTGAAHWEVLLRARAIETQSYVLAPNQVGIGQGGVPTFGNSMIIDPWGKIMARGSGEKEEILLAEVDVELVADIRKKMVLL